MTAVASRAALTPDQRAVVEGAYDVLVHEGRWATFGELDRRLYRADSLDVLDVLKTLTPDLVTVGDPHRLYVNKQTQIPPTFAALFALNRPDADADLRRFVNALRWIAKRELTFVPSDADFVVTRTDLADVLDLDPESSAMTRLGLLLYTEAQGWSSAWRSEEAKDWSFTISREIRTYSSVLSPQDYLAKKAELKGKASRRPSERPAPAPRAGVWARLYAWAKDIRRGRRVVLGPRGANRLLLPNLWGTRVSFHLQRLGLRFWRDRFSPRLAEAVATSIGARRRCRCYWQASYA